MTSRNPDSAKAKVDATLSLKTFETAVAEREEPPVSISPFSGGGSSSHTEHGKLSKLGGSDIQYVW